MGEKQFGAAIQQRISGVKTLIEVPLCQSSQLANLLGGDGGDAVLGDDASRGLDQARPPGLLALGGADAAIGAPGCRHVAILTHDDRKSNLTRTRIRLSFKERYACHRVPSSVAHPRRR